MRRAMFLVLLVLAGVWPSTAGAFVNNVNLSVGEGVGWARGKAFRLPVSVELVPSVSFAIVKVDLGLYVTVEKPVDFVLRPGIRVCLPWFYFRAAVPLRVTRSFDYGFLLGAGATVLHLGFASLFLEADTFLTSRGEWGKALAPLEFRAGIEIGF